MKSALPPLRPPLLLLCSAAPAQVAACGADVARTAAAINEQCCGSDDAACSSGVPTSCDAGCAGVFLPFSRDCPEVALPFASVVALCEATVAVASGSNGWATFDVRTFGAIGDGYTDDTRAFEAAVAAVERAGGGTVLVPAHSGNPPAADACSLTKQLSSAECVKGESFGCLADKTMYISGGCRGVFDCGGAAGVECNVDDCEGRCHCPCESEPDWECQAAHGTATKGTVTPWPPCDGIRGIG